MGRAMLIIVAGVLFSVGLMGINTANQGMALTERTVNYAEFTMGKNAAHTAIQMAMQEINQDPDFPYTYGSSNNPWIVEVQGLEVKLHVDIIPSDDYWEPDFIWVYSRAPMGDQHNNVTVEVKSHYLVQPFSSLVPDFVSAISFPTDNFTLEGGGNAKIFGSSPHSECEDKPPFTVASSEHGIKTDDFKSENLTGQEPLVTVDEELSYRPTDEMIARLKNAEHTVISNNYKGDLGSAEKPGVFFVEDAYAKLAGGAPEGFGILIVRSTGALSVDGEVYDAELDVVGNFKWNGLIIFENADAFTGAGTPKVNGSVIVGRTDEDSSFPGTTKVNMTGNAEIQYDCLAEKYAKMAAADAVKQNKYTLVVSTENFRYPGTASSVEKQDEESKGLMETIKNLL